MRWNTEHIVNNRKMIIGIAFICYLFFGMHHFHHFIAFGNTNPGGLVISILQVVIGLLAIVVAWIIFTKQVKINQEQINISQTQQKLSDRQLQLARRTFEIDCIRYNIQAYLDSIRHAQMIGDTSKIERWNKELGLLRKHYENRLAGNPNEFEYHTGEDILKTYENIKDDLS